MNSMPLESKKKNFVSRFGVRGSVQFQMASIVDSVNKASLDFYSSGNGENLEGRGGGGKRERNYYFSKFLFKRLIRLHL